MNRDRQFATPWGRAGEPYHTRGSVILKLALGEAPASIHSALDIRRGAAQASGSVGIHPVDRVLDHFTHDIEVYRVHSSLAGQGSPGAGHTRFDDVEQAVGLSRTFEIDFDDDGPVADVIDALRQLAVVEQAYPHYLSVTPFAAPSEAQQAAASRELVRATEAMAYEPGDPVVIVAVVDTGVMLDHPELRGRFRRGRDTVELAAGDLPAGMKLVPEETNEPIDLVGHGTACAGIIGAAGTNMPPGLAGRCGMLPIRVLGSAKYPGKSEPVGIGAIADIDCGVKLAIDLGAKVLNFSFGTPEAEIEPNGPPPHFDVVQYGLLRGAVMVAASGNSGKNERFSPAALDGVMAVGSVDSAGEPSAFSTRGDHVALSAPGEGVLSASLHGYSRVTGTSFAAPSVSAAAALLVSRAMSKAHPLPAADVTRILTASARPWRPGRGQGGGAGILDAAAALQTLDREIEATANQGRRERSRHAAS